MTNKKNRNNQHKRNDQETNGFEKKEKNGNGNKAMRAPLSIGSNNTFGNNERTMFEQKIGSTDGKVHVTGQTKVPIVIEPGADTNQTTVTSAAAGQTKVPLLFEPAADTSQTTVTSAATGQTKVPIVIEHGTDTGQTTVSSNTVSDQTNVKLPRVGLLSPGVSKETGNESTTVLNESDIFDPETEATPALNKSPDDGSSQHTDVTENETNVPDDETPLVNDPVGDVQDTDITPNEPGVSETELNNQDTGKDNIATPIDGLNMSEYILVGTTDGQDKSHATVLQTHFQNLVKDGFKNYLPEDDRLFNAKLNLAQAIDELLKILGKPTNESVPHGLIFLNKNDFSNDTVSLLFDLNDPEELMLNSIGKRERTGVEPVKHQMMEKVSEMLDLCYL